MDNKKKINKIVQLKINTSDPTRQPRTVCYFNASSSPRENSL